MLLGSLSMRVFETRTATRSELFSLLTCLHTTTCTLPSIFSPLEMICVKMWETPLSWHSKGLFRVVVPVSKTRVLKLPIRPNKTLLGVLFRLQNHSTKSVSLGSVNKGSDCEGKILAYKKNKLCLISILYIKNTNEECFLGI